jgi:hypothetical protein
MADVHQVADVFTNSHFIYTSWKHGHGYVNYRPLGKEGQELLLREVCAHLLNKMLGNIKVSNYRNIVAIGPETMGAKMIKQIRAMSGEDLPYNVDTRMLLKDPDDRTKFVWEANPERVLNEDSLVLWMDDLLNLASTFNRTAPMIYHYGATIHSVGVIGNRSIVLPHELSIRQIVSLEKFELPAFDQGLCPYCEMDRPVVTDLGHGLKWQELHPDYAGDFRTAR